MYCFGVCNSDPDKVAQTLINWGTIKSVADIYQLPYRQSLKPERVEQSVLFMSAADALHNAKALLELNGYQVFVFDSPLRFVELEGLVPLDMEAGRSTMVVYRMSHHLNRAAYQKALRSDQTSTLRRRRDQYLYDLMDVVKGGRFVTPLVTAVNCLPAGSRLDIIECVCETVMMGHTNKKAKAVIGAARIKGTLSDIWLGKLIRMLEGEVGQGMKDMFAATAEKAASTARRIAKEVRIKPHEAEYVRAIMESVEEKRGAGDGKAKRKFKAN